MPRLWFECLFLSSREGRPTNHAAMGKLLGKALLEKRSISFLYLLVVLIDQK